MSVAQPPPPAASRPPLPPAPPQPPADEPARQGGSMAWRFLAGALAVVVLSGAATAIFALAEVHKVIAAFEQHKAVKISSELLTPAAKGAPQTLLLVGNDERPLSKHNSHEVLPHSNEMLLVRIDPNAPTISMLSIPRELQVPIHKPDGEIVQDRINSAYTYGWLNGGGTRGGIKLMLETVKEVIGISAINHVFITNFKRFEHAVQEMGCVYMMVDKRYEHTNTAYGEQYLEIHLQPGYQRLCGQEALEYVANRHESTSLIRDARDQRFMLEVKAEYGPTLFESREKFEHIFGKAVESTLQHGEAGEEEVLQLVELMVRAANKPVRQVHFNVQFKESVDVATPEEIHEAVRSFLGGTGAIPTARIGKAAGSVQIHGHGKKSGSSALHALSLSPTPAVTLEEARNRATGLPFALEEPFYQQSMAEAGSDELHLYRIPGPHRRSYSAYVLVVPSGEVGQYYDVQGTTWPNPPIFNAPSQQMRIGGREYSLYYDGEHIKTIAWREHGGTYWIENTLSSQLSPQAIVALARETRPVSAQLVQQAAEGHGPALPAHNPAPPPRPIVTVSSAIKAGDYLGFALAGLAAVLFGFVLARWRQLRSLRGEVAAALAAEAQARRLRG